MCNITIVDDSMSKQFSKEKGNKMSALPATVGGLSVDIPVGTVRRALAIAELSGSDTVSITISMERLEGFQRSQHTRGGTVWQLQMPENRDQLLS